MKLAAVHCPNPACHHDYEAVLNEGEWHAECPRCGQNNRVAGMNASKEITGYCNCGRPMDDHIFGREKYACPGKGKAR